MEAVPLVIRKQPQSRTGTKLKSIYEENNPNIRRHSQETEAILQEGRN
jgi:hypothetical protein